jgi:hypothetical protein
MPAGPLYNALCVVHAAAEILSHAARIRASQIGLAPLGSSRRASGPKRRQDHADAEFEAEAEAAIHRIPNDAEVSSDTALAPHAPKTGLVLKDQHTTPLVLSFTPSSAHANGQSKIPEACVNIHSRPSQAELEQPGLSSTANLETPQAVDKVSTTASEVSGITDTSSSTQEVRPSLTSMIHTSNQL